MPLTRYVPAGYPIYGLQARDLDGVSRPPRSIRDMAAEYIEYIRTVQGSGPYHLLGWSFGGAVAHEIAVQMQDHGESVAALIVMDSIPSPREMDPTSPGGVTEFAKEPGRSNIHSLNAESRRNPEIAEVTGMSDPRIREILRETSQEELEIFMRIVHNNQRIMHNHEPRCFRGDLLFIRSAESKVDTSSIATRWEPYVSGEISEFSLPCNHYEMTHPEMLARAWAGISKRFKLES